ncbi:beta-lactamase/transpeptidase-like protein [Coprinopsis marcescibilis]|uniref:Beta-lactamase/transpeptidase-like protein n=1 Tax=Coprinopsis marcescibilis TaxID=230819 RepID=A0A5C3KRA2_COPMA|nr:beta-lactamase/transpeptidase-like protein [Coprinopsis marcescibilis]
MFSSITWKILCFCFVLKITRINAFISHDLTLPFGNLYPHHTTAARFPPAASTRQARAEINHSSGAVSLISESTSKYIKGLITEWNSTGLGVAVIQKLPSPPGSQTPAWKIEFGSYGISRKTSGSTEAVPVTPDTIFAIASNSKLFLSISIGLLISNQTLADEFRHRTGQKLTWKSKMVDLMPERWKMWDEEAQRSATIQDLLSHRTGLPRHDFSGTSRNGDVGQVISVLRHLRPSASFRETVQYNNLMYESLSYLPRVLLNQTYENYVREHLLAPLNMTSTTFNVHQAETDFKERLAHGHLRDMRDFIKDGGPTGTLKPLIPYFFRPGEERTWAGAGGILSTPRDLSKWMAMLLNDGRHPDTNEVVVPADVLEYVTYGRVVTHGSPEFAEFSPKVYGCAQWRYTYQGCDIIEHGGNNAGFKSQVARFPGSSVQGFGPSTNLGMGLGGSNGSEDYLTTTRTNGGLGIITLSNDGDQGGFVLEASKWRISEDILGLERVDWNSRYKILWSDYQDSLRKSVTPRPLEARLPSAPLAQLGSKVFRHGAYGTLTPCLITEGFTAPHTHVEVENDTQAHLHLDSSPGDSSSYCNTVLSLPSTQRLLAASNLSIPTFIASWDRTFSTHLRLTHFDGNTFNVSVVWTNNEVRIREGYHSLDGEVDEEAVLIGLDDSFEVEWVTPDLDKNGPGETEGLSFKRGFWGKEGIDSEEPQDGLGKDSAEVWFGTVPSS